MQLPFVSRTTRWGLALLAITFWGTGAYATSETTAAHAPTHLTIRHDHTPMANLPGPPQVEAAAYILLDVDSGRILAQHRGEHNLAPASLTKLLSFYVVANALHAHQIQPDDRVLISREAWKTGGSRMFVRAGSHVPVHDLIAGMLVASGNDATVALAEYVGGSVQNFTSMMNNAARMLGMEHSHFTNPTGLPNPQHTTTPNDLAKLSVAILQEHPHQLHWFREKWFTYGGIRQPNRNRLLWQDPSVLGMKTGHTDRAGYCLAAAADRKGMRLLAIVMGAPSDRARTRAAASLLNYGYHFYATHHLFPAHQVVTQARVWQGREHHVPLGLTHPWVVTLPRHGNDPAPHMVTRPTPHLIAPIHEGETYGTVQWVQGQRVLSERPLVALKTIELGNVWQRFVDRCTYLIHRWMH